MFEHPKTIAEQIQKRARKQVSEDVLKDLGALKGQIDGATQYNIWYNRWTGYRLGVGERAPYKLNPKKDIGWTIGEKNPHNYFCMFFARGACPYGSDCRFYHRIPCAEDREEMPVDIFGRERHGEFRGDLGGTGAFSRENRTLYVGRIAPYDDIEKVIREAFSPFGEIVKLNVLHGKCVAFVQYSRRIYAEFAKEAMSNQSLERREILNVRWATEDPNPDVKKEVQKKAEEEVYEALKASLPVEITNPILTHNEEQEHTDEESDEDNYENHGQEISNTNVIMNEPTEANVETTVEKQPEVKPNSSLIDPNVLSYLGYTSKQTQYTKAYLKNANATQKKRELNSEDIISAKKGKVETKPVSLLGDEYESDSDD